MQNRNFIFSPEERIYFKSVKSYFYAQQHFKIAKLIFLLALFLFLGALFIPWQQTTSGQGQVVAFDPNDRVFPITALVNGRIKEWHVKDGEQVKKGQKIVELIDNDPLILQRLQENVVAAKQELEANERVAETAKLNSTRQLELFKQGLSSQKEMEKAKIEYEKLVAKVNESLAKLSQTEIKISQQTLQAISAPQDGVVTQIISGSLSTQLKAGDPLAMFVPILKNPAIVFYVNPNDMQFIYAGRKLRIQFQGWPSVQFSGWPSVAIGTFGGIVKSVDPHVDPEKGLLRVIAVQDPSQSPWPDPLFLRVGANVNATIILSRVPIGYEIWRQLNNFPLKSDQDHQVYVNSDSKKDKK